MTKINLREQYPDFYKTDYIIEVPDEVAAVMKEHDRLEAAYRRRTYYHKAHYSLDRGDGIEYDGAVREVMKELLRSDLRFHKTDCGRSGAMTAWGLKDTSSRPAKDLGGTLRHTIRTMLRSYDSRASGDLLCSHRQGAWQI